MMVILFSLRIKKDQSKDWSQMLLGCEPSVVLLYQEVIEDIGTNGSARYLALV